MTTSGPAPRLGFVRVGAMGAEALPALRDLAGVLQGRRGSRLAGRTRS